MRLKSTVLIGALLMPAAAQRSKSVDPCASVEANLRVSPTTFRCGARPTLTVVVRNASPHPIRLLDIRNGRRPDLADNYYEVVLEQNQRVLKNVPHAISDPGPIAAADFFVVAPDGSFRARLSSSLDVSALSVGRYSAHVRITFDPLNARMLKCSSRGTSFTVTK